MSEALRLAVCCTDRGQHDHTVLGELDLLYSPEWPDGFLMAGNELGRGHVFGHVDPDRRCVWWDDQDGGRAQMRCPRCGRHVQWRGDKARQVIRTFNEADDVPRLAGLPSVDISHVS
jgi:hypothetical protein